MEKFRVIEKRVYQTRIKYLSKPYSIEKYPRVLIKTKNYFKFYSKFSEYKHLFVDAGWVDLFLELAGTVMLLKSPRDARYYKPGRQILRASPKDPAHSFGISYSSDMIDERGFKYVNSFHLINSTEHLKKMSDSKIKEYIKQLKGLING